MKKSILMAFMLLGTVLGLTACSTVSQSQTAQTPGPILVQPAQSGLDQALPAILANHEHAERLLKGRSVSKVSPIFKPANPLHLPVPLDESSDEAEDTLVVTSRAQLRYSERDLQCLATNAYYEAGSEGDRGMAAVTQVVLNRVKSGSYATSICGVIYQRGQFSWTRDKRSNHPSNKALYERAKRVARGVLDGNVSNPVGRALSFHNTSCRPSWTRRMRFVCRIGGHLFYS